MNKSAVAILVAFLALIVFDVYVFMDGGTEATISHTILVWSYKYPFFTFTCGFLMGHLFWRIRDTKITKIISDNSRK